MTLSDSNKKAAAEKCITHHYACDCREAHFREMETALQAKADKLAEALEEVDKCELPLSDLELIAQALKEYRGEQDG